MSSCKLIVRRIKLNRQGYEPGRYGRYFGVGEKLWAWECGDRDGQLRAPSYSAARKAAKSAAGSGGSRSSGLLG